MSNAPKQLANQQVSVFDLNSTGPLKALAVVQLDSTGGIVSGGAGGGSTQVSVRDILTSSGASVMDGVNNAINVNVVAGAAAGSTYVSVRQSTAADLNAAVVQGSTVWQVQVSTVAGIVAVRPMSTLWASSAGFHFDSSGALLMKEQAPSTGPVAVSSIAGVSRIAANNAADGIVHVGDSTNAAIRVNVVAGAAGGSTQVSVKEIQTSSGASVMDSTNAAVRVNVVAGSAAGSTAVTVSQLLDSSGGTITAGDSANQALRVNVVAGAAGGSTYVSVRQSTAADLNAAVVQASTVWQVQVSSIAGAVDTELPAAAALADNTANPTAPAVGSFPHIWTGSVWHRLKGNSNGAQVIGPVPVDNSGAASVAPLLVGGQASAAAPSAVSADGDAVMAWFDRSGALAAQLTASGVLVPASTTTQSTGSVVGLNVRPVQPSGRQSTTAVITSTASTALYTLVSSAAGLKHCVTAYFVGSTHTVPSTLIFWSSNSIDRWAVNFGSGSSGITGANLATYAPDWLFQTDVANALRVSIEGGSSGNSTVIARVSLKWFTET